jgi:HEAT repeat protein
MMPLDLDELMTLLAGGDVAQQASAAEALARMGRDAAPAAATLVRASGSADELVREWAAAALEELGPPPNEQIGEFIQLVGHQSPGVRYWATTLLGRAGADAQPAVGVLVKTLGADDDNAVCERSAWALGKIGPGAKAALPALQVAAASKEPRLARLAADAIQAIGE